MASVKSKGPSSRMRSAVSRAVILAAVIVVIIIILAGSFAALTLSRTSSTSSLSTAISTSLSSSVTTNLGGSSSSSASSESSTTSAGLSSSTSTQISQSSVTSITSNNSTTIPSSMTYETLNTPQYLDPALAYSSTYDINMLYQPYESLVWYNGGNSTGVIPWLAQNYTVSPSGRSVNFNLRGGIKFADGEPFNSTAVYFSFNRVLIEDGGTPSGHGIGASWILQQLTNRTLSTTLGGPQNYSSFMGKASPRAEFCPDLPGPFRLRLTSRSQTGLCPIFWRTGLPISRPPDM